MVRSPLSKLSILPIAAASVALLSLHGCPDPAGVYDDFESKGEQYEGEVLADALVPDMALEGCPIELANCMMDGDYLLTLATQIDPSKPVQFRLTVSFDGETSMLDWSLIPVRQQCDGTPCATDDPRYREELAEGLIDPDPVSVDADGNFTIDFGTADVPGDGNAISGTPIQATLLLKGQIVGDQVMCGKFSGMLIQPFEFTLEEPENNFGTVFLEEGDTAGSVNAVGRCQ